MTRTPLQRRAFMAGLATVLALASGQASASTCGGGVMLIVGLDEAGLRAGDKRPNPAELEAHLRRQLAVLKIDAQVADLGHGSLSVRFADAADAARFRALLEHPPQFGFYLVDDDVAEGATTGPPGDFRPIQADGDPPIWLKPPQLLGAGDLATARAETDAQMDMPVIAFRLTPEGGRKFAQVTSANVGRRFAIVLDGRLLSAPVIQTPIVGGSGQITGAFTREDAEVLANLMSVAGTRGPLKVLEQRDVP